MAFFLKHKIQTENSIEQRSLNGTEQTLDRLYKRRDLEISNLWQRSVFLAVFLTLVIGAYGALISKTLDSSSNYNVICLNIGCIALAILSLTFALIWILMAKASKAWYEVYEKAITEYEKAYWRELSMPPNSDNTDTYYRMGCMTGKEINNDLHSLMAGAFSPSKLNIMIGYVFWTVSIFIYLAHSIYLIYFLNQHWVSNLSYLLYIIVPAIIYLSNWLIKELLKKHSKSSFLDTIGISRFDKCIFYLYIYIYEKEY